jgi:hypothetical protein
MRCNQKDTSAFSFKELLEMKEKKPIELMPPPRTPIRTMKDIIQELRKNLTETPSNIIQNKQLQEELNKIKSMNKDNSHNNSFISSNNFNSIFNNINNNTSIINITNNENDTLPTEYDIYLNHNNSNNSHNEQNLDEDNALNLSLDIGREKEKDNYIKFNKLPNPKNKSEIKIFVNNLLCYINFLLSCPSIKNNNKINDELVIFKYKLETRYNDYRNNGLNEQYFINILNKNQEELINKLKETIKIEKKEENSNIGNLNIKNIINIHNNYFFMGKKRKKSLSEIKSITDGSSSYEGDFP